MNVRALGEKLELAIDRFAYSGWSSVTLWVYSACWIISERGNIGWDGVLTIVGVELALSIRRWQGKKS